MRQNLARTSADEGRGAVDQRPRQDEGAFGSRLGSWGDVASVSKRGANVPCGRCVASLGRMICPSPSSCQAQASRKD
eukprot:2604437-Prymnesium_polylepis.1